ncbi:glycoside hydrolase family 26 protein [Cellulomonas sp. 179-A 4D5 NHS]|uniref:glycoside hydrolase family 26 protein n=1 Tax=Cellulomonas sp. 179-A 4D5 NHS TaxID=3142378 RepID=UPI00399FEEEC
MSDRRSLSESAAALGRAWWAPTMGRLTARGRFLTVAVVAALVVVTLAVWNTPDVSATGRPVAAAATATPSAEERRLARELAAAREDLAESRAQSQGLRETLGKEQAARLKGEQESAAAQQEAAAKKAAAGTGSSTGGSSARSGSAAGSSSSKSTKSAREPGTGPANTRNPTQPAGPAAAVTTRPTAPSKAELVNPTRRQLGLYTAQAPFSFATFDDVAARAGVTPTTVGWFSGWDKPFRADAVTKAWDRGLMPLLTWESHPSDAPNDELDQPAYSLPVILGDPGAGVPGAYDAYLRQYARDVAALGLPLGIRLDHEMNGDWYPWSERTQTGQPINGNRVGDYAAMWRHVHGIFEQEGAGDLVVWVWAPNIVNNLPASLQAPGVLEGLYPGDEYVDWVGLSGYNRPPYRAGNDSTFAYTFGRSLDQLRAIADKPILLAEIGASEVGGTKPQWIASLFEALTLPENDDVIGLAWFNLTVTSTVRGELVTNDWRIDSRRASTEAFTAGITNPLARFVEGSAPLDAARAAARPAAPVSTPSASPAPSATVSTAPRENP